MDGKALAAMLKEKGLPRITTAKGKDQNGKNFLSLQIPAPLEKDWVCLQVSSDDSQRKRTLIFNLVKTAFVN